jgi:hypothetical protein
MNTVPPGFADKGDLQCGATEVAPILQQLFASNTNMTIKKSPYGLQRRTLLRNLFSSVLARVVEEECNKLFRAALTIK